MLVDNLALVAAAAFAGIALYISLAEHPARLALDDAAALAEWRPSYQWGTIIQGGLALLGGAFGLLSYALTADWTWLLGSLVLLANWPYTYFVIKPVNDELLAMASGEPERQWDARSLLERWGRLHWNRTLLGAAATLLFIWVAV